jgi:serine/threonine protein kinase
MLTSFCDWDLNLEEIYDKVKLKEYNDCVTYKAKWRYENVFIKVVKNSKDVDNELEILSKCIHPKICQFLGASKNETHTSIIFEYMDNGDLYNFILKNKLSDSEKINLIMDIAIGLNYLIKRKPKQIMHRDLKPSNIMINKHKEPKISDFGISKLLSADHIDEYINHTGETGTYLWMAPEIMKHELYNYKSDIYSFGLIIYYIWTEKIPFCEYRSSTIQLAFLKINDKLKLKDIDHKKLNELIKNCINEDKTKRPTCDEIIDQLKNIKTKFNKSMSFSKFMN